MRYLGLQVFPVRCWHLDSCIFTVTIMPKKSGVRIKEAINVARCPLLLITSTDAISTKYFESFVMEKKRKTAPAKESVITSHNGKPN